MTPVIWRSKERAINAAELEWAAGLMGPSYLAGVPGPWHPDRGQAPVHYDQNQVDMRQDAIDTIKHNNAVMCQLEYTANKSNKHGPSGQGRR